MSAATRPPAGESRPEPVPEPGSLLPPDWYDRSSLVGDFLVTIEGQTEGEYLRRAPEHRTCEFIDGTVSMPSPADLWHQVNILFLASLLNDFTGLNRSGLVFTGPAVFRTRPGCDLEPDIFVIPQGGESQMHGFYCDPPALLVVEILSKSTRSHDLNRKAALYREAAVPELWFVDDRDRALIVESRTAEGYDQRRVESGPVRSAAIPGFWFNVDWFWARPRPIAKLCLDQILAGPPA